MKIRIAPEYFFLLITGLFGLVYALAHLPLEEEDGTIHCWRIMAVGQGHVTTAASMPKYSCIAPVQDLRVTPEGRLAGGKYPALEYPLRINELTTLRQFNQLRLDHWHPDSTLPTYHNVAYTPMSYLPYLPFAAIVGAAIDHPLTAIYALRLGGFLVGTALVFLALRLMPAYRWLFALFLLLPSTVIARSTLTADQATLAYTLLILSCVLRLRMKNSVVRNQDIALLALLAISVSLCKCVYFLIPAVIFLIPRRLFFNSRRYWLSLAITVLLPAVLAISWDLYIASYWGITAQNLSKFSDAPVIWSKHVVPAHQAHTLLSDPGKFFRLLWRDGSSLQFWNWMASGIVINFYFPPGYDPLIFIAFFSLLLLAVLQRPVPFTGPSFFLNGKERVVLLGVVLATAMALFITMYLDYNTDQDAAIAGVRGRYFLPLFPLLLLSITPGCRLILLLQTGQARYLEPGLRLITAAATIALLSINAWHMADWQTWLALRQLYGW